jgi:anti-sigma-K factor RskA
MRRPRPQETNPADVAELAALADGSLSAERRAALEARVAASPELADRLAEQERALTLAHDAAAEVAAPHALRERIDALGRARRPRRTGSLVLIGAVAAAVVAVAIGSAVFERGPSGDRFAAELIATELAPGARGEATFTKTSSGWRIELDATGLPRLENGRFYQAWLRNSAGALVPVGTFNEGRDVTLWAGVSPLDFPTITVTRERNDDDQASSGERVLVGTAAAA